MTNLYEYRRLPFCDPQKVCQSLMELEDQGYDIFKLEPVTNGTEYLVYIRRQFVVPGATYIITKDTGKMFHKGDYFIGRHNNWLEHARSGVKIEYTVTWKDLIVMVKD